MCISLACSFDFENYTEAILTIAIYGFISSFMMNKDVESFSLCQKLPYELNLCMIYCNLLAVMPLLFIFASEVSL